MGTNYYVANLEDPNDDPPGWHIGKQSAGWEFIWAEAPVPVDPIDLQWLRFAATMTHLTVVDEYGEDCGPLVDFVKARQGFHSSNPGKGWC